LPYRVIDLTDDRGSLAGMLLAQLGADVIAVEPPEGQRTRRLAPFADDQPGPEQSLVHRALNRGKRSVVVATTGELERLVEGADVVLHSGAMDVDLDALRAAHPQLVTVNITPFGETGPKADWAATDLTLAAASGTMSLTGDDDRAPLRLSEPVVWNFAALDAACAALLALTERARSGRGQHASVSAQASYISTNQLLGTYPLAGQEPGRRVAGGLRLGPLLLQILNKCADGYVAAGFLFGPVLGPYTVRLWNWVHSEGGCPDSFLEVDWVGFGMLLTEDPEALEMFRNANEVLTQFLATKTRAEVAAAAAEHRLLVTAASTTGDLLASTHFGERGYWDVIDGVRHNGRFARFTSTPLHPQDAAPGLGQHTEEVVAEPVTSNQGNGGPADLLPLDGVKVLDFSWAIAGPEATRHLADFGATVVRVESEAKPDPVRGAVPFLGEQGGFEGSLLWHSFNAGKLSFPVDIGAAEIRPVIEDLVRWADVVVESFSVGVLASHGLGPEQLLELNPEVIILSSTLAGQTGPMRKLAGFGTTGAAVAGLYPTTGWPDRDPAGPWGTYTDFPAPRFAVIAILAALDHRRRGGGGQHIDFSQAEGSMHLLGPAFLDDEVNSREGTWNGNADRNLAPHGVYPVAGDDRWIAIACESDEQWQALAGLMDSDRAGLDLGLAERHAAAVEIDADIADWTSEQEVAELEELLQAHGIAAHRVAFAADLQTDPQLAHCDHYARVAHPT
ncbi:MAG: CoA transferase, partial [Actinomycetota bacterium]